jgi:hypothetical protein
MENNLHRSIPKFSEKRKSVIIKGENKNG